MDIQVVSTETSPSTYTVMRGGVTVFTAHIPPHPYPLREFHRLYGDKVGPNDTVFHKIHWDKFLVRIQGETE